MRKTYKINVNNAHAIFNRVWHEIGRGAWVTVRNSEGEQYQAKLLDKALPSMDHPFMYRLDGRKCPMLGFSDSHVFRALYGEISVMIDKSFVRIRQGKKWIAYRRIKTGYCRYAFCGHDNQTACLGNIEDCRYLYVCAIGFRKCFDRHQDGPI